MRNINQEFKDSEEDLARLKAQKPTLTPVSFESKWDLASALSAGRTFKTPGGDTLMYTERRFNGSPFRIMRDGKDDGAMINVWDLYDDLEEINAELVVPWYLNIPPEGIVEELTGDKEGWSIYWGLGPLPPIL